MAAIDHEIATFIVTEAYAKANNLLNGLLGLFARAEDVPANLRISDAEPGGWHGAEVAIDKAVKRGDWLTTLQLTDEYVTRIERFCNAWRVKLGMPSKEPGFE
jgi:hypothetical protein